MKRKLSLLMAFMMAATLLPAQPAFAATRNVINKTITTTSDAITDETTGVVLTLGVDNAASIYGAKAGQYFELHLDGDAKWTYGSKELTDKYAYTDNVLYPANNHTNDNPDYPGLTKPSEFDGKQIKNLKNS